MRHTREWVLGRLTYALWVSARPHQWIKNAFVFLPVLFAERVFDPTAWCLASATFLIFCLAASGVYLWNDVADRAQDRVHPLKKLRPVASGALPVSTALAWAGLLAAAAVGLAFAVRLSLGCSIVLYIALNVLYTRWLRALVIMDVFCIAALFVLRVVTGLVVLQVQFSYWMVILVALLALFLALNKRRYELTRLARRASEHRPVLQKYSIQLIDQMCAALMAAVIVAYILFTVDPRKVAKFGSHNLLFSTPFVCYGIFRYQYLVFKRGRGGDPAHIVLADRVMLANLVVWAVVCGLAVYARREWIPLPLE